MADQNISLATLANTFNKTTDERIKKAISQNEAVTLKAATVSSINASGTVNVIFAGQTQITNDFPNFTNCDLEANDSVWVLSIDGNSHDETNSFIAFRFSATPPKIGYSSAYLYPKIPTSIDSGLICKSSDNTLKVVMNSDNCFAIYKGTGTGLDNSWTLIQQLSTDGLAASKIFQIGDSTVYGVIGTDSYGFKGLDLVRNSTDVFCRIHSAGAGVGTTFRVENYLWLVLDNSTNSGVFFADTNSTYMQWGNGTTTNQVRCDNGGITFWCGGIERGIFNASGFTAYGTKSSAQFTKDFGVRQLYAYETPENKFADYGRDQLVNGECKILIEPIFAETINLTQDYDVYLTKYGKGDIWVDEMTPEYFIIKGDNDIKFSWNLVASRLGYENIRLKELVD